MYSNDRTEGGQFSLERLSRATGRRDFIKWTGLGAAGVLVGCDEATRTVGVVLPQDTVEVPPPEPTFDDVTLDFSDDFGVLNYAYALEQLEAAFYATVVADAGFASTFNEQEQRVLVDLRDHEVIHRQFYAAAIPALGGTLIPGLTPDFSSINFSSRLSVLETSLAFEELGVAAYNGAARFLESAVLLTIAGKIVSVEARHASTIADRLNPRGSSFAPRAFDQALSPAEVLNRAAPFIENEITPTNVPD
jgi:hypothetical protein